jgi:hypothetical protein
MKITHPESIKRLKAAVIDIDDPDAPQGTGIVVEEPDGCIRVCNRDGEIRDGRPIARISKVGVEAIDSDIGVVCSHARGCERGLGSCVIAARD